MVVCRFFLQGTCRYGSNCRYEHSYREYGNEGTSASRYRGSYESQYFNSPNRYSYSNQNTSSGTYNARETMQMVITELIHSEKGGQWPLSCFAPFKERPCYPGLEDYSPEEIRWSIYRAIKSGTAESCKQQLQHLYNSHKAKKEKLMHPTSEEYAIIEKLYKGEIQDSFSHNSPVTVPEEFSFNLSSHKNIQNTPQTNVFGGSHPNALGFASRIDNINTNLFGGAQQSNNFDTSGTVPVKNIFGAATQTTSGVHNAFGTVTGGTPQTIASLVLKPTQTSFNSSPFRSSDVQDEQVYSRLDDLTEDDKNAFQAQTFTMGHVPTKPPPKEYVLT